MRIVLKDPCCVIIDARSQVDRGVPGPVKGLACHDDVVSRTIALKPDKGVPAVDLHAAGIAIGAVQSQVDRLRPGPVGIPGRHVDVRFVPGIGAVMQARPVRPGKHRRRRSVADDPRPEIVPRVHEIEPLSVAGDRRRIRPPRRGVDRYAGGGAGAAAGAAGRTGAPRQGQAPRTGQDKFPNPAFSCFCLPPWTS